MSRERTVWILAGALLGAVIVVVVGQETGLLSRTATGPGGIMTSYSVPGRPHGPPTIEVMGLGDTVFVASGVTYAAGTFVCQASVTGNADEFGDALFAVWVHGSDSSQLLGSEIAGETETAPVIVVFRPNEPRGLGVPPYSFKVEAVGIWKVLCKIESDWD